MDHLRGKEAERQRQDLCVRASLLDSFHQLAGVESWVNTLGCPPVTPACGNDEKVSSQRLSTAFSLQPSAFSLQPSAFSWLPAHAVCNAEHARRSGGEEVGILSPFRHLRSAQRWSRNES